MNNTWQQSTCGRSLVFCCKRKRTALFFPVGSSHREGYFSLVKCLLLHNHLAYIERSPKVGRSQCLCVMRGLECGISLTLHNDYGNNMIICRLFLRSFFLTAKSKLLGNRREIFFFLSALETSPRWRELTFSTAFSPSHSAPSCASSGLEN